MHLKAFFKSRVIPSHVTQKLTLLMKLTSVLILGACLQAHAVSYAQNVSLSHRDAPLEKVFKEIRLQTGYNFIYTNEVLSHATPVSINLKDVGLKRALDSCFHDQPLSYLITGNIIIVRAKESVKTMAVSDTAITVSGIVVDSVTQTPLSRVTIQMMESTIGAMTDENGRFTLSVPATAVLEVSYLGYNRKVIPVRGKTYFKVYLASSLTGLNQVVVVGYGTQKKRDLTGSLSRVDLDQQRDQPNINAVQNLRGRIAGVSVIDDGIAGSDASIVIRGRNSISGSNAPLIVLDGVIYEGSLSDINSDDIASIDILKDASASAIYGSLAANGVILVTTKQGSTSKPDIAVKSYYGLSDFAHIPRYLDAKKYIQVRKDAEAADGGSYPFQPLEVANMDSGRTINPWDAITQRAPVLNNYLSVSGQRNEITYYLSGSYSEIKSPRMGDNFNRLTTRINVEIAATPWLKLGINDGYSSKEKKGIPANLTDASYLSPYADLYYDDGVPRPLPMNVGLVKNPLTETLLDKKSDITKTLFTNTYANIELPLTGLSYRLSVGFSQENVRIFEYTPSFDRDEFFNLGSGSKSYANSKNLSIENLVKYHRSFHQDHELDVTLLYGIYTNQDESSSLSSNNIFNDALGYNSLQIGENFSISSAAGKDQQISSMARVGYSYKGKYVANATIRRDGYSAFGAGKKYGVFPAFGVSWILTQEPFLSDVRGIDNLKLRASWGENGNRGVSRYSSLSNMSQTYYVFGDGGAPSVGLYTSSLGNPKLGWETTTSLNFGADFDVLATRISGSVDYYLSKTHDLLLRQSIPSMSGYTSILRNIGETQNNGFELSLTSRNIRQKSFTWTSDVTFSLNRNEIVHLTGQDLNKDGKEDDDIASKWFIGHPLGSNFDYVFDGIFQTGDDFSTMPNAKPGYIRFKDINGDGAITPDDRKVIGSDQPDFVAGITNTFTYKQLSLSAFIYTRQGGESPNSSLNPGTNFYYYTNILDVPYWTPDNPINSNPGINYPNPLGYGFYQSRSFVRLQDISLSYTFSPGMLKKIHLNSLQVFASGKNLVTWTRWKGWDPENGVGGRSNSGPILKTYVLGLNIKL